MKMTQAWGWLVAGVVAAGLNASYHDGGLQWAHQIADRLDHTSQALVALASGRADEFVAQAQMLTARNETASARLSNALVQVQSRIEREVSRSQEEFDRVQAVSDREQARQQVQCDRLEAARVRIEAKIAAQAAHLRIASAAFSPVVISNISAPVVCPRIRINAPRVPRIKMPVMRMQGITEIHVETSAGPV